MKGIVLSGDSGNRLYPITAAVPKQLLPIYDKPMVLYPIQTLVRSGITDILLITTKEHQLLFQKVLGDGSQFRASITYAIQHKPEGIAQAISIGEEFIGHEPFCLITGDTILDGPGIESMINKAIRTVNKSGQATIFVEKRTYPNQYGKVIVDEAGRVNKIVGDGGERYYYSIASIYIFPNSAVKRINDLNISERNRLEIIKLSEILFKEKKLQVRIMDKDSVWLDTNSFESILRCGLYMSSKNFSRIRY